MGAFLLCGNKQRALAGRTLEKNLSEGRATEIVAKKIGIFRKTSEKAKLIIEKRF